MCLLSEFFVWFDLFSGRRAIAMSSRAFKFIKYPYPLLEIYRAATTEWKTKYSNVIAVAWFPRKRSFPAVNGAGLTRQGHANSNGHRIPAMRNHRHANAKQWLWLIFPLARSSAACVYVCETRAQVSKRIYLASWFLRSSAMYLILFDSTRSNWTRRLDIPRSVFSAEFCGKIHWIHIGVIMRNAK